MCGAKWWIQLDAPKLCKHLSQLFNWPLFFSIPHLFTAISGLSWKRGIKEKDMSYLTHLLFATILMPQPDAFLLENKEVLINQDKEVLLVEDEEVLNNDNEEGLNVNNKGVLINDNEEVLIVNNKGVLINENEEEVLIVTGGFSSQGALSSVEVL